MKTYLKIANIRGTIFVPRVAYIAENLDKMRQAFKDYMPTVLPPQATMPEFLPGYLAMNTAWRMVSPEQKETVTFYDDKEAAILPYVNDEDEVWSVGLSRIESCNLLSNNKLAG